MEDFQKIKYRRIQLDSNYDRDSMNLEKFEESMLSSALLQGGVVVWEELLNSREDDGDFKTTLTQFKENCEFLWIWKYMTSNPHSLSVKNLELFLNFADVDEDKTRISSRIGEIRMMVERTKMKDIFGFVDPKLKTHAKSNTDKRTKDARLLEFYKSCLSKTGLEECQTVDPETGAKSLKFEPNGKTSHLTQAQNTIVTALQATFERKTGSKTQMTKRTWELMLNISERDQQVDYAKLVMDSLIYSIDKRRIGWTDKADYRIFVPALGHAPIWQFIMDHFGVTRGQVTVIKDAMVANRTVWKNLSRSQAAKEKKEKLDKKRTKISKEEAACKS